MFTYEALKEKAAGKIMFPISYTELGFHDKTPVWKAAFLIPGIAAAFRDIGVKATLLLCYNDKNYIFVTKEFSIMRREFSIEIPYKERDQFENMILEINRTVSNDGMIILAVCNDPYDLRSYLFVDSSEEEASTIKSIILKNNLSFTYDKGLKEVMRDMASGNFWEIGFLPVTSDELVKIRIQSFYRFPSGTDLKAAGILEPTDHKKKKVFISYCHKDQKLVTKIVNAMMDCGINAWFDKMSIDVGDDIFEKMLDGIHSCDLGVFFMSKNYQESVYAKFELRRFWQENILQQKQLFPILIDDSNPSEIYPGLQSYKYFRYQDNLEELLDALKRKIQKLS